MSALEIHPDQLRAGDEFQLPGGTFAVTDKVIRTRNQRLVVVKYYLRDIQGGGHITYELDDLVARNSS